MKRTIRSVHFRIGSALLLILSVGALPSFPLHADCERRPVVLQAIEDQIYSLATDEEAGIVYLRSVTKRDELIMARIDPRNPGLFQAIQDQSPLAEVNRHKPIGQPCFASFGGNKYLYFVQNPRGSGGKTPYLMAARLDQGRWRVPEDLQRQFDRINAPGAEMTPVVAEGGKVLYFTSDSDRERRTCAPFMQFLSGFCWRIYKATRRTLDEPFELRGDGRQVLPSGCLDLFYDECWSGAAAPASSDRGVFVFNYDPLPGKVGKDDYDNIWRVDRREDGSFTYPVNMVSINLIEKEPMKEAPSVTQSGRYIYWFSGKLAHTQSPYYLPLANIADVDRDGFDDCVDLNDRAPDVYPGAPENLNTLGTDNDVDGWTDDVDLYVSPQGTDSPGCGDRSRPCRTIQHGIDKVQDGSIIHVLPGLYQETIRIVKKWISLVSVEGPETTTIQGVSPRQPVVSVQGFRNRTPLLLKGFTIRGPEAPGAGRGKGGGLYLGGTTITVANNIIRDNQSSSGGGIYLDDARARIVHNVIVNNSADTGGGIFVEGGDYHMGRVLHITDNIIVKNRGGGIYLSRPYRAAHKTPPLIARNNVWSNEKGEIGGCRLCEAGEVARANLSADPQFADGTFRLKGSSPSKRAGALFLHPDDKRSDVWKQARKVQGSSDIGLLDE